MSAAAPSAMLIESDSHVRDLMRAKLAASGISVTAERPHGIAAQQAIQEMQPQLIFVAVNGCQGWIMMLLT